MMGEIEVGIGEMAITATQDTMIARSIGSCVAVALYDPMSKVYAMAHVMLPDSKLTKKAANPAKFADTAVSAMLDKMRKMKAKRNRIVAKIAGGAKMFSSASDNGIMNVGPRIVEAVKNALKNEGIRIVAQDVGKDYGRTVEFNTQNRNLTIKSAKNGVKII